MRSRSGNERFVALLTRFLPDGCRQNVFNVCIAQTRKQKPFSVGNFLRDMLEVCQTRFPDVYCQYAQACGSIAALVALLLVVRDICLDFGAKSASSHFSHVNFEEKVGFAL